MNSFTENSLYTMTGSISDAGLALIQRMGFRKNGRALSATEMTYRITQELHKGHTALFYIILHLSDEV